MDISFDERVRELRLQRIQQLSDRLLEDLKKLKKDRIPASKAARLLIESTEETKDPLVPFLWREASEENKFRCYQQLRQSGQAPGGQCCTIV